MAYMNQERKQQIAAAMKPILKAYGLKGSLSVNNHSTIVLKIKSGKINFVGDSPGIRNFTSVLDVNPYHYQNQYVGQALEFLKKAFAVLNNGNHDNSDISTDYFDVGWYVNVRIGEWNKPYILEK